jgi:hypothetical protein
MSLIKIKEINMTNLKGKFMVHISKAHTGDPLPDLIRVQVVALEKDPFMFICLTDGGQHIQAAPWRVEFLIPVVGEIVITAGN